MFPDDISDVIVVQRVEEWLRTRCETFLDAEEVYVADEMGPFLSKAIAGAGDIRSVRLPVDDLIAFHAVLDGAMANTRITAIYADLEDRDEDEIHALARYVARADWLKQFIISYGHNVNPILDALKFAGQLHRLTNFSIAIDDDGAVKLAEALARIPELKYLDISMCTMGTKGLEAIFGALADTAVDLERLELDYRNIRGSRFMALARLLRIRPLLEIPLQREIDVPVDDESICCFVELGEVMGGRPIIKFQGFPCFSPRAGWAMGHAMHNVRHLELTNCNMDDECPKGIAFGVRKQPNDVLEDLMLKLYNLPEVGWFALAEAVAVQKRLRRLRINIAGARVANVVAHAIKNNTHLRCALLEGAALDHVVIFDAIANSTAISTLRVVGRPNLRRFFDAIKKNTSICSIAG